MNDDDVTRKLTADEQRVEFVSSALVALAEAAKAGKLPKLVEVTVFARHDPEMARQGITTVGKVVARPQGWSRTVASEKYMMEGIPRWILRSEAYEVVDELLLVLARRAERSDEWEK